MLSRPQDLQESPTGIPEVVHPDIPADFAEHLDEASRGCQATAREWASRMTEEDLSALVRAFYEAESLAQKALEIASDQVGEAYREGLARQIADEERHIDVFARWGGATRPVVSPAVRQREEHVWFTILLVNELTGYCQFTMLHALLDTPGRREDVAAIVLDEQEHVGRLMRWLLPLWSGRKGRVGVAIIERFRRGLEGRMFQFFPREELGPLRTAMVRHVDALLDALLQVQGRISL